MNNQRVADDLLKKVDGHLEELKGKLMEAEGEHVKGGVAVAGGKLEDKAADMDFASMSMEERLEKHIERAKRNIKHDIKHALQ